MQRGKTRIQVRLPPWVRILWLVLFLAPALGACGLLENVNHLRDAQQAFSEAAAAENRLRFDMDKLEMDPVALSGQFVDAKRGYATALDSLTKLLDDREAVRSLTEDQLLGNVYALKAMAEWRLGRYDAAKHSAQNALKSGTDQLFPRDRALMTALPGLIKNDQAFALLQAEGDSVSLANCQTADRRTLCRVLNLHDGAIENYEAARKLVPSYHPIQIYLVQAEIIAFSNLRKAVERFNGPAGAPELVGNTRTCDTRNRLVELQNLVKAKASARERAGLQKRYEGIAGLPTTACPR